MTDFSRGYNGRYILDARGNVMPEPDLLKWAMWIQTCGKARRVEWTELESGAYVSTIFLGLDYNWDSNPLKDPLNYRPVLWETMAFEQGTRARLGQRRYASREDAARGHWEMVEKIKQKEADDAAELRNLVEAQTYMVDEQSITCLTCGMRSWNPIDIQEKYCGHCHKFHEARK